mmetsp:Transcript_312/g.816  ORF Transcript_312/g.816 Transcript_312/m.816 type:complete len:80 (+) Transcript_312:179-418(+)
MVQNPLTVMAQSLSQRQNRFATLLQTAVHRKLQDAPFSMGEYIGLDLHNYEGKPKQHFAQNQMSSYSSICDSVQVSCVD